MAKLTGTNPDQVPTNADLGTMAYQDKDNVNVGSFTSNGIDDNATSTAMTLDSSGNLLVGTTLINTTGSSSSGTTVGLELQANGELQVGSDGDKCAIFNRQSSDGEILRFRKDGTTVGSIGNNSTNLTINGVGALELQEGGTTRAYVESTGIHPWVNNTYDLGTSGSNWKDLYLSGGVVENTTTVTYAASIALTYDNGSIQTVTLTGNVTFTDSLADGESIVLMLNAGASYTVTFPTMTWVSSGGNAAPTLTANDTIVFWKIGSTLYGAYAGSYT